MKNLYLGIILLCCTPYAVSGQLTYPVNVVNNEFQPSTITISQGDAISWECSEGFHNVDGSVITYPDNPEGFSSGEPENAPWTYEFTFTAEGVYQYRCVIHSSEMTGTVIVGDVMNTVDQNSDPIALYPNPTENFVTIEGVSEIEGIMQLKVFDITGKKILEETLVGQNRLDLSDLKSGIYFYNIFVDNELIQTGKLARN
jgi:plastocyanin